MAAPGDRCPQPFLLLLLLLFLLLPDPALGNEGGAAGSCRCREINTTPPYLDKLESCETCQHFTRFNFPKRRVCGLNEATWVKELKESHCRKKRPEGGAGKADASRGDRLPTPTSPTTVSTPTSPTFQGTVAAATSPSSTGVSSDKSQEMLGTTESHRETASEPARAASTPEASAEAAAGEASKTPLEEKKAVPRSASDAKTTSIAVLCAGLLAGFVILVCWKRRRRCRRHQRGQRPQSPLGEEGTHCLPGDNT